MNPADKRESNGEQDEITELKRKLKLACDFLRAKGVTVIDKLEEDTKQLFAEAAKQLFIADTKLPKQLLLRRPDGAPVPNHWSNFTVGELVIIKDCTFRVSYVGTLELRLNLSPRGIHELRR